MYRIAVRNSVEKMRKNFSRTPNDVNQTLFLLEIDRYNKKYTSPDTIPLD
jgi:hypothetical protein